VIGKLTGVVESQTADALILDVNGVGYVVQCSPRTLSRLPAVGERVSLAIETQMREDAIRLFGFTTGGERDWFRLLQGVQGVGSKVALAILGVLPPDELTIAIGRGDKTAIARAPGVGPKLAARIAAELKDKAPSFAGGDGPDEGASTPAVAHQAALDAIAALVNLGYGRPQVVAAVEKAVASLGAEAAAPALIRHGLKLLSA
jgi:holliday junction DNA helicase RuvA